MKIWLLSFFVVKAKVTVKYCVARRYQVIYLRATPCFGESLFTAHKLAKNENVQ